VERVARAKSRHHPELDRHHAERGRAADGPDQWRPDQPCRSAAQARFATLSGADLSGADLSNTDLSEARLNGANLAGADLTDALLDQADFAGARLAGVNLSGTSLLEVRNITQAQVDEARGDLLTLLPPHLSRPRSWTGTVSQVVGGPSSRPAPEEMPVRGPSPREPAAPVRGERVSWLVGGPRSGETSRSTTPLRGPQRV
jgi:hypothetical protein